MSWIAKQIGKYRESITMALEAIVSNKLRSGLTILGVLIGVTTVVSMMSIIGGLNTSIEKDAAYLSGPTFEVATTPIISFGPRERNDNFTIDDANAIMYQCPHVSVADVESFRTIICEYGGAKTRPVSVTTTSTGFFDLLNEQYVENGRIINQGDVDNARNVVVIGPDVAETLFGNLDPIGRRMKADGRLFTVIGVFASKGEVFGTTWDNYIVIPETTYTKIYGKSKRDSIIFVRAVDVASLDLAMDETESLLRRRRGVKPSEENDFYFYTSEQVMQLWTQITGGAFAAMLAIAGISLLVGGIGIMNIMLVAVTERTREIGLRKALGARRRDIMTQFVSEAVVVSLLGGVSGLILGVFFGNLVGWITPLPSSTSIPSLFIGFSFSVAVGLFFGIYPAIKASKLNPIEALRFE